MQASPQNAQQGQAKGVCCVVTSPKRKKRVQKKKVVSEELIGVALMDDALIEYLCDSGAMRTIIAKMRSRRLKRSRQEKF